MKKLLLFLVLLTGITWVMAQTYPITLEAHPTGFFNYINAASLDPEHPELQPLLFSGTIHNVSGTTQDFSISIKLEWNDATLFSTYARIAHPLAVGGIITITSRDLIRTVGSTYFNGVSPSLSFNSILNSNPTFKDALMRTGRFPDGEYVFSVQAVTNDAAHTALSQSVPMRIVIRNANAIYLNRPGVQLGNMLPSITMLPITFSWSSNLAGLSTTQFTLTIKEFDRVEDITPSSVENSGKVFLQAPGIQGTVYNQYLPFISGKYYAWKVSVPLNPMSSGSNAPVLDSPWYGFKYFAADNTNGNTSESELLQYLKQLNDPTISGLINGGFSPSGKVSLGDQDYTGQEAIRVIQGLSGKTFTRVTISNE